MPGKNEQDPKRTRKISLEKQKSYINEQEYHQKIKKLIMVGGMYF